MISAFKIFLKAEGSAGIEEQTKHASTSWGRMHDQYRH